jgi:hypothetical protein
MLRVLFVRTVVRNSFARNTVTAERVRVGVVPPGGKPSTDCAWCGGFRATYPKTLGAHSRPVSAWLYRFHVDDDGGRRNSGPIAGGRLFCSRGCCESYTGQSLDETK